MITLQEKKTIELEAYTFVNKLGIPANFKGRKYLIDAIRISAECPETLNCVTKRLYPKVAELHDTNGRCVERDMRTALKYVFKRDPERIKDLVCASDAKLTNLMVIAFAAEEIRRVYL